MVNDRGVFRTLSNILHSILETWSFHVRQFAELKTPNKALDNIKNEATIYT